jgi:hypothetical protein
MEREGDDNRHGYIWESNKAGRITNYTLGVYQNSKRSD